MGCPICVGRGIYTKQAQRYAVPDTQEAKRYAAVNAETLTIHFATLDTLVENTASPTSTFGIWMKLEYRPVVTPKVKPGSLDSATKFTYRFEAHIVLKH